MIYLVFTTKRAANKALKQINSNMQFPKHGCNAKTGEEEETKGLTTNWANIETRLDKCHCFPKPSDEMMAGVEGCTEEEYSAEWFPEPELEI